MLDDELIKELRVLDPCSCDTSALVQALAELRLWLHETEAFDFEAIADEALAAARSLSEAISALQRELLTVNCIFGFAQDAIEEAA